MSNLTEYRLDELCEIIQGTTPPTKTKSGKINPWVNNEILFYRGRDFTRNDRNTDKKINIDWIIKNKKERNIIKEGDISIYTNRYFKILELPVNSFCALGTITLRNKNKGIVNSHFLLNYLKMLKKELTNKYSTAGIKFNQLKVRDLLRIPIFLPPIEVQNKIGEILKLKGELLKKIKETIRNQEKEIDLFFKTVSKKLENSDSKEYRLDELCEIIQGVTPPTKIQPGKINPWVNNEILFYRGRDFTRNDGNTDKKINIDWIKGNKKEELLIRDGDFSIYDVGTINLLKLPVNSIGSNHVITLRNKNKDVSNSEFLFFYLKILEKELNYKYASMGTLFKTLRVGDLLKVPIFLPPIEVQNKIGEILKTKGELLKKTKETSKVMEQLLEIETKLLIV